MADILIWGMEMRENMIEHLRFCATHFSCDGCVGKCSTSSNEPRTAFVLNDAADAIEELESYCKELESKVPHWISVEERLPTDEDGDPWDRCIVYTDEDTIQTLPLCKVGNGYVTHWMKIEPPQTVMQIGVINCSDL